MRKPSDGTPVWPLALMSLALLCFSLPAWAAGQGQGQGGGSSATGTGGSPSNPPPSEPPPSEPLPPSDTPTQSPYPESNSVGLVVNGSVTTLSGDNHDIYGNPVTSTTNDKPAVGIAQVDGAYIDGPNAANPTAPSGVSLDGQPTPGDQLTGGMVNNIAPKTQTLEEFILAAANSADYTIDLSSADGGSVTVTNSFGGPVPNDYKIVYAKASDPTKEGDLHLSGNLDSFGVLVVEVNDPDTAQFVMSGGYKWTGLILVVMNQRGTGQKALIDVVGGGNSLHVVGGAVLYARNQPRPDGTGSIYGQTFYQTRGQSDLVYSYDALMNAKAKVKSSCKVRSWRKLD